MAEYPWLWFASHDGESWHETGAPNREGALEFAQDSEYAYIGEGRYQNFDLTIDGDDVLERLDDRNADLVGEDGDFLPDVTKEQERDLTAILTAAMAVWVEKHGIKVRAWAFSEMRNVERIPSNTAFAQQADD